MKIEDVILYLQAKESVVDSFEKSTLKEIEKYLMKLQEFEKLSKEKKLVRLPCKVGDILYYVNGPYILEAEIIEYWIDDSGIWNILTNIYQKDNVHQLQIDPILIGKKVFLTKVEAEEKIKEKHYE